MVERLGWTLIHFVWEGTVVAALLAALLWLTRRGSSGLRYGLSCLALLVIAACPIATYLQLASTARESIAYASSTSHFRITAREAIGSEESIFPVLVRIWLVGVGLLSARLVGTLIHVERWKRRHARPASAEWQDRVDQLSRRLGISRGVRVLVSERIGVPSAWGVLKSVIVLPTSMLTQLSPSQIETILLHELAHIRRHDYLVNLLQTVVETALFYHPAVWWISNVVRREREHCCDDVVIDSLADPMPYARALLLLEERRAILPRPTLSAKGSNLMNRIARILGAKPAPVRISPLASTLAGLAVLGAVLGGSLQAQAQSVSVKGVPLGKKAAASAKRHKLAKKNRKTVTVKGVRFAATAKPVVAVRPAPATHIALIARPAPRLAPPISVTINRVPSTARAFISTPNQSATITMNGGPLQVITKPLDAPQSKVETRSVPVLGSLPYVSRLFQNSTAVGNVQGQWKATNPPATVAPQVWNYISKAPANNGLTLQRTYSWKGNEAATLQSKLNSTSGVGTFQKLSQNLPAGLSRNLTLSQTSGGFGHSFTLTDSDISIELDGAQANIDVKDASMASTLRKLAKKSKLSVVIEAGSYEDITLVLSGIAPQRAIEIICKAANATYKMEGGVYYISPAHRA